MEYTTGLLGWALLVSNYGGWLITAVKAAFHALVASIAIAIGFKSR
jgi:hypothetical protein